MVMAATVPDMQWIVERTQCGLTPGARAIKAVDDSGRIRGMVAYDGWTLNAVQAHMAVDSPIVWRSLTKPAFSYPFLEAGRGVILAAIPVGNAKSINLAKRFGFRDLLRIQDGWAVGEDLLMLEMRREECRWILKEGA